MNKRDAAQESYGAEGLRPREAPALIECPRCGGSGFETPGTGYGNVCSHCGGLRCVPDQLAELVSRFSAALLEKLRAAEKKYGWKNGWKRPNWEADCQRQLLEHVAKGDPRDVAAYAAFCWHHGWRTAPIIHDKQHSGE
ncbi:hypothetical protein [Bradyrhizobium sp. Tv2a-2]|uniref:hypothetical protein n=1 Tax=Bradyrhizobium sp. Tv2a-2 TaxID=113395 RepID=UPI0012EC5401|nr:hypothetical protein [Bradyrhizobium sp. Tv2a-2]